MKTILKPKEIIFDKNGYSELVSDIDLLEANLKAKDDKLKEFENRLKFLKSNLLESFDVQGDSFELMQYNHCTVFVESNNFAEDRKPKLSVRH